jgi:hypothetical protein
MIFGPEGNLRPLEFATQSNRFYGWLGLKNLGTATQQLEYSDRCTRIMADLSRFQSPPKRLSCKSQTV